MGELKKFVLDAAQVRPDGPERHKASERMPQVDVHINRLDVKGQWVDESSPIPGAIVGVLSDIESAPTTAPDGQDESTPKVNVEFAEAESYFHEPIRAALDPNRQNPADIQNVTLEGQSLRFAGSYAINNRDAWLRLHVLEDYNNPKIDHVVSGIALQAAAYLDEHARGHDFLKPDKVVKIILYKGSKGQIQPETLYFKPPKPGSGEEGYLDPNESVT